MAASADSAKVCCARCGQALARGVNTHQAEVPFEDLPDFVELEDWEFAETIQEAERLVRTVTTDLNDTYRKQKRWDPPHDFRRPASSRLPAASHKAQRDDDPTTGSHSVPWLVLAMGLGVFVCGAALVAISLVSQRPQLWQLGLPLVLGGQVAVLAVVVSQLDAVWNSNRATFVALHSMDEQVRQLREEWSRLQQQADLESQPFYRHLAEGASPEVLLADLRDQIDVLSQHLAQTKRAA